MSEDIAWRKAKKAASLWKRAAKSQKERADLRTAELRHYGIGDEADALVLELYEASPFLPQDSWWSVLLVERETGETTELARVSGLYLAGFTAEAWAFWQDNREVYGDWTRVGYTQGDIAMSWLAFRRSDRAVFVLMLRPAPEPTP